MEHGKVVERVFSELEKKGEELIHLAQQLVRIPSVVGSEGPAQAFVRSKLEEMSLDVRAFEARLEKIQGHPAYIKTASNYEGRPNIVATIQGSPSHRSLILNGHVDVVSPEPLDQWSVDPWGGVVRDGRLYGRGAVDMKAGLIANLVALKAILDSGIRPKGSLTFQSVVEEEAGGSGGALACFAEGYAADGLLIPEPSNEFVVTSHNGVKYFRVRAVGRTAHAALSHTGVNAIGKMNRIYDALIALDEKRAKEHRYPLVERWGGRSCNLNVGTYRAGDWASSVAGMATMECRIGFVPGEKGPEVVREVEETVRGVAKGDSWLAEHLPTVEWYGWDADPWLQDENAPFVQSFLASSSDVLGQPPGIKAITGGLDTRFGPYFGTPSFVFGPKGDRMHGPDEYVDLDSLRRVTRVIAKFILDWCGWAS